MNRILSLILICALLAGCAAAVDNPETTVLPIIETEPQEPGQSELTTAVTEIPETQPVAGLVLLTYELYLPNDNADGFESVIVETDQITAESVLAELQTRGALPETVAINSFSAEGSQLNIDFNRAFGDLVCSTGTAGELMITGSMVNTYLSAFQAESVFFTVEGEILESGHVIYDFPLTFAE